MLRLALFLFTFAFQMTALAQSFDHSHHAFSKVLSDHVVVYSNGLKSAVNYSALAHNRPPLDQYLVSLSEVEHAQYENWTQPQQLAFLINAYNGFTLQLIINNIGKFESGQANSIRDLGGFFSSPWKQSFLLYSNNSATSTGLSMIKYASILMNPVFMRHLFVLQ